MSLGDRIVRPSLACNLGLAGVEPSVLLWGSHAVVTASAQETAALRNDGAFRFAASVDCPTGFCRS
jgi:hypothetical protein